MPNMNKVSLFVPPSQATAIDNDIVINIYHRRTFLFHEKQLPKQRQKHTLFVSVARL